MYQNILTASVGNWWILSNGNLSAQTNDYPLGSSVIESMITAINNYAGTSLTEDNFNLSGVQMSNLTTDDIDEVI